MKRLPFKDEDIVLITVESDAVTLRQAEWWEMLDWKTMPEVYEKLPEEIKQKINLSTKDEGNYAHNKKTHRANEKNMSTSSKYSNVVYKFQNRFEKLCKFQPKLGFVHKRIKY